MENSRYKKPHLRLLLLAALFLVVLIGIAGAFFHKRNQPAVSEDLFKKLKIERPSGKVRAPGFTLADLNGKQITLKRLKGKVVFLNFWATWCPPCVQEMPRMETLHQELGSKGLTVLAIDYQEDAKNVKEFFSQYKLTFTALLDHEGKVSQLYQTWGLPMTVIVNKRGEIIGKVMGPRDWHSGEAKEFFERLLAEQS